MKKPHQMSFDSDPGQPSPEGQALLQKPLEMDRRQRPAAQPVPPAENVWSIAADPVAPPSAPPAPPPEVAVTVPAHPAELTLASRWQRLLAWLVDGALLGGLFVLYCALGLWAFGSSLPGSREGGLDFIVDTLLIYSGLLVPGALLVLAVAFVYGALFGALGGRTPGKRLARIRVVRVDGSPLDAGSAAVRGLLALVSFLLGAAGLCWALVDRRGQALHDKLVKTVVVSG